MHASWNPKIQLFDAWKRFWNIPYSFKLKYQRFIVISWGDYIFFHDIVAIQHSRTLGRLATGRITGIQTFKDFFVCFLDLLQIEPAPNNGTIGSLNRLLVPNARAVVQKSKGDGTVFRTDICKFPNDEIFVTRSKNGLCSSCKVSYFYYPYMQHPATTIAVLHHIFSPAF